MTMNDNDKTIPTPRRWITKEEALERWPPQKAVRDFTRVCREQGLDLDYGREEK